MQRISRVIDLQEMQSSEKWNSNNFLPQILYSSSITEHQSCTFFVHPSPSSFESETQHAAASPSASSSLSPASSSSPSSYSSFPPSVSSPLSSDPPPSSSPASSSSIPNPLPASSDKPPYAVADAKLSGQSSDPYSQTFANTSDISKSLSYTDSNPSFDFSHVLSSNSNSSSAVPG